MAFPQVIDADTKNGVQTSNSSSWTLTYPTNLANGDLILSFVGVDGGPTFTWPAIFTRQDQSGSAASIGLAWGISDGTQSGNFTLTLGASEQGGWRIFRITGVFADADIDNVVTANRDTTGSPSNTPNPPNLIANVWTGQDLLWFAAAGVDTSRTFSAFPSFYTNTASDVSGGSGGASLGLCRRELVADSENPGTFTISASDDWVAATVAVRPAAGAPPATSLIYAPRPMIRNI